MKNVDGIYAFAVSLFILENDFPKLLAIDGLKMMLIEWDYARGVYTLREA